MAEERDRLFQEFKGDGAQSMRAADDLQPNLQTQVAGDAGMDVQMKSLVLDAAGKMKFADRIEIQLVEKATMSNP